MSEWVEIKDNCDLPPFNEVILLKVIQQVTQTNCLFIHEVKGVRRKYHDELNIWGWDIEGMPYRHVAEYNDGPIFRCPIEIKAWMPIQQLPEKK